jgi:hypothetical protein
VVPGFANRSVTKMQESFKYLGNAWRDYILNHLDSVEVEGAAAAQSAVKERYSNDLQAFYCACEAVMECTEHVVMPEAEVFEVGEPGVAQSVAYSALSGG